MARSQKKADCNHVLKNWLNDAVGDPANHTIIKTIIDRDILDLISKPRLILDQMSAKREAEILKLQDFQVALARTLSLCISYYLGDQVISSFRYTLITPNDFNECRVSAKCSKLGKQNRDCADRTFLQITATSRPDLPKA